MATTKISVVSTKVLRQGTSQNGRAWTLYEVIACNEHGEPIERQLKSFDNFPPGPVEVEVEKQTHEKYGESYLLKRAKTDAGQETSGLRAAIDELRGRVERIEQRLGGGQPAQAAVADPAANFGGGGDPASWGPQRAGSGHYADDDDIPF